MSIGKWQLIVGLSVSIIGCGGGEEQLQESSGGHEGQAAASPKTTSETIGSVTLNSESEEAGEEEIEFIPPFADQPARDPFAPLAALPEIEEPEPEPEPVMASQELPTMKLVGFVKVDDQKAMLKFDSELVLVSAGDTVSGVEILEVDSPALTMKFGDRQIAMNLFDRNDSREARDAKLSITRAGAAGQELVGQPTTGPGDPRRTVPTLPGANPTANPRPQRIPGLPGSIGRPAVPAFPTVPPREQS